MCEHIWFWTSYKEAKAASISATAMSFQIKKLFWWKSQPKGWSFFLESKRLRAHCFFCGIGIKLLNVDCEFQWSWSELILSESSYHCLIRSHIAAFLIFILTIRNDFSITHINCSLSMHILYCFPNNKCRPFLFTFRVFKFFIITESKQRAQYGLGFQYRIFANKLLQWLQTC